MKNFFRSHRGRHSWPWRNHDGERSDQHQSLDAPRESGQRPGLTRAAALERMPYLALPFPIASQW
jgi:hypothetical protein